MSLSVSSLYYNQLLQQYSTTTDTSSVSGSDEDSVFDSSTIDDESALEDTADSTNSSTLFTEDDSSLNFVDSTDSDSWANTLFQGTLSGDYLKDDETTTTSTSSSSSTSTGIDGVKNSATGSNLAKIAESVAKNMNTQGQCKAGVRKALEKALGMTLTGISAYMSAPQLASSSKFKEITVSKEDLPNLPAGAIVVWQPKSGHPHGHISVALGDGREASSCIRNQITNYGSSFRVFVPVDMIA